MTQPPFSGAPIPVPGVTGGPPVLGGQIGNDPNDGSLVIQPNPGNVLQIRKGSQPTALQLYEFFTSNTVYSRLAFNTQTNGPFIIATESQPSVVRELDINASGALKIQSGNASITLNPNGTNALVLAANGNATFTGQILATNIAVPIPANVLNLGGGTTPPWSIIFSIGGIQPWAFATGNAFTPTANNSYDIGQSGLAVRTAYLAAIDYNGAGNVGQGNGGVGTVPPVRGTGFGPLNVAGVGWIRLFIGGSPIYLAYWQ